MRTKPLLLSLAVVAVILALAAGGCGTDARPSQSQNQPQLSAPPQGAEGRIQTVRIPVDGMSCSACVASIKAALSEMDGVSRVQVDLGERRAQVQFAVSKISAAAIVAKINELGFQAGSAVIVE